MNNPVASPDIDPIDRLTILAAALPGALVRQRQITAPFDAVWRVVADLEQATPRYEPSVAHVRVIERHGERISLVTCILVLGAVPRLMAVIGHGVPTVGILISLAGELIAAPLLWLWQRRVAGVAQRSALT